jgi:hypothetical protein
VIGDYLGIVVRNIDFDFEKEPENQYLMYYHDRASIIPEDISRPGVHCINHSCEPNCWIYPYYGHTLFVAIRDINKGEELTISYLLAPKGESCKITCPHICKCESKNCTGFMHVSEEKFKLWKQWSEKQARKTPRKRIAYGKPLKKLDDYPEQLPVSLIYQSFS